MVKFNCVLDIPKMEVTHRIKLNADKVNIWFLAVGAVGGFAATTAAAMLVVHRRSGGDIGGGQQIHVQVGFDKDAPLEVSVKEVAGAEVLQLPVEAVVN